MVSFPQLSPLKPCKHLSSPPDVLHAPPTHLILLYFITPTILGEEYLSLSSSLCSFLHSLVTSSLLFIYSPQHPILKHPQPTLLPQCKRPSFTPMQNNRQNYSSVYLNLILFIWICTFYPKICDKNKSIGRAYAKYRSQCPSSLRLWSAAAHLRGLWVRIPPALWMSVSFECYVLSRRCLCVGLITCPEESYRVWCAWV